MLIQPETAPTDSHYDETSLADIARQLNITRERARQIEKQALAKCEAWCRRRGIKFEDVILRD